MAFNLKIILHRMGLDGSVFFSQASRNRGVNYCLRTRENANNPDVKTPDPFFSNFVKVPVLSNTDCQGLAGNEKIQNSMLCAGGEGQGAQKVSGKHVFLPNRGKKE